MIDLVRFSKEFQERFDATPQIVSAPGRVNLIGEHTDYNEGFVLPFAIDKRTFVGFAPRRDGKIRAHTLTLDKSVEFDADERSVPADKDWSLYLRGMIAMLSRRGVAVTGADLLIDSDIPFGAGLSSSAALEIAIGFAFVTMTGATIAPADLALAGQQVEHEYAGVRSGIMDQLASALSMRGQALLIDCRTMVVKHVPLHPDGHRFVVCDTQVKHELASSEYNRRREECEEGVEILKDYFPAMRSLRDVAAADFEEVDDHLPETIRRRCRHVIRENERTLDAADAIRDGSLARFGELMYGSHDSLRDDYEVSCAELDLLVETARETPGVIGSRMTGGGFGGCTITLIDAVAVESFSAKVIERYADKFGREPLVFTVEPSDGAHLHDEGETANIA